MTNGLPVWLWELPVWLWEAPVWLGEPPVWLGEAPAQLGEAPVKPVAIRTVRGVYWNKGTGGIYSIRLLKPQGVRRVFEEIFMKNRLNQNGSLSVSWKRG